MSGNKDSGEIVVFMTLFQKLRDWIDDDPEGLYEFAATDDSVAELQSDAMRHRRKRPRNRPGRRLRSWCDTR